MDTSTPKDRDVIADRMFLVKPGEWSKKNKKYTFPAHVAAELVTTGKAHYPETKTAKDSEAIDPAAGK